MGLLKGGIKALKRLICLDIAPILRFFRDMLNIPFKLIKPALHALDPEDAHSATMMAIKSGLSPQYKPINDPRLEVKLWNKTFPNPVGLAAGFDKNAEGIAAVLKMGFGFTEVGTVTPKPQAGNPRPRIFRDPANEAVINRMGFPNKGLDVFKNNVTGFFKKAQRPQGIVGLNIGMNKDQTEPAIDYCTLIAALGNLADYFTINISSPNTPGLRNLQQRDNLLDLIARVQEQRAKSCDNLDLPALLIKLAPDLDETQQQEIAQTVMEAKVDGLILTNTTLERPDYLTTGFKDETGGLSGAPVRDKSTQIIHNFYKRTEGKIPIIGVGGISNGQDAYEKIKAGASMIQIYSALVYHGPALATKICKDLLIRLEKDGFDHISKAVGTAHN